MTAENVPFDVKDADEIYIKLVSQAGLFGKAFFGHRHTKREQRQMTRLWKLSRKIADERAAERETES